MIAYSPLPFILCSCPHEHLHIILLSSKNLFVCSSRTSWHSTNFFLSEAPSLSRMPQYLNDVPNETKQFLIPQALKIRSCLLLLYIVKEFLNLSVGFLFFLKNFLIITFKLFFSFNCGEFAWQNPLLIIWNGMCKCMSACMCIFKKRMQLVALIYNCTTTELFFKCCSLFQRKYISFRRRSK